MSVTDDKIRAAMTMSQSAVNSAQRTTRHDLLATAKSNEDQAHKDGMDMFRRNYAKGD